MSRADVETEILEPMQLLFEAPKAFATDEKRTVLNSYVAILAGFDADTLRAAWAEVVASQRSNRWPVPGVIVMAARRASKDRAPGEGASRTTSAPVTSSHTERFATWRAVRSSPLARLAASQGVAWSVKCLVLDDGVTPDKIDLRKLVAAKMRAQTLMDKINAGQSLSSLDSKRDVGVMRSENAQLAGRMFATLAANETDTAQEIAANALETERAA